jgi:polyhydroxybutyrate depolymerase
MSIRLLLVLSIFAVLLPAQAQEGPIRQRLRERWAERHAAQPAQAGEAIHGPGDYSFTITSGGQPRSFRVHVPRSYSAGQPAPLLVALHGGGGNMELQANDTYYGEIGASEKHGFIALFPNGFSRLPGGKLATWNAGRCCGAARDTGSDDVAFIRAAVEEVARQVNVDRRRVYATGMSNGAMMAYRLACEAADLFSGIAAVAGTDNTTTCHPMRPVAVLHIHAKDDTHVLFGGGAGPDSARASSVTDYTSVADTVAKWTRLDACSAAPRRVLEVPGASCELYEPCAGGSRVQLCVTDTGGHSWPGGQKPRGGPAPSTAISANDVMWDFFSRR